MDEQSITAGLLKKLMSAISEDYWCAGWTYDLEYRLWEAVTGKRTGVCNHEEIEQLKYLSEKCGGWIVWDEQSKGEKFVPIGEWRRLCEAHSPKTSEEE